MMRKKILYTYFSLRFHAIFFLFCTGYLVAVTGCTAIRLARTTADLEAVTKSQKEWGKIALSEPNFVANTNQFNINFNEDVSNYVQSARISTSANANSSLQSALYIGALLQGMFAPPIAAGSSVLNSSVPLTNIPSQVIIPNQAQSGLSNFASPTLATPPDPTIDERVAVEKGINDKLAELFLRSMASPNVNSNQEAIVFGVMQATCQPGQMTRKGYIAELDVFLKYGRYATEYTSDHSGIDSVEKDIAIADEKFSELRLKTHEPLSAKSLANPKYEKQWGTPYYAADTDKLVDTDKLIEVDPIEHPDVLAVLPLMDSRNMDLQHSGQQQVEVALALSAAFAAKGMNAAANLLSDYVKREQSSIESRNSLPVATTYSDGMSLGFQLYPSVQALENPGSLGDSAESILQPVTFPIVVVIKVQKNKVQAANPWIFLVTETQTRWLPLHPSMLEKLEEWTGLKTWYGWKKRVPLFQEMYRARNIDDAKANLNKIAPLGERFPQTIPAEFHNQYQQLQIALDTLKGSSLSRSGAHLLPQDLFPSNSAPTISDVYPKMIWRNTATDFVILVKNLEYPGDVDKVMIEGKTCTPTKVVSFGTNIDRLPPAALGPPPQFKTLGVAISVTLPAIFQSITNSATNGIDFVVTLHDQKTTPLVKTVQMTLQGTPDPEAVATITRDANGKVSGIDIKHGQTATEQNMLNAVQKILMKSEPVTTNITIIK